VRFISEFAPGGLIDEATVEEKELAWMPTTNDEMKVHFDHSVCSCGSATVVTFEPQCNDNVFPKQHTGIHGSKIH